MNPNLVNGDTTKAEPARHHGVDSTDVSAALRELRNRSPEESLGVNTQNSLLRASIQAGVVTAVLFAVLTVVPYVLAKVFPPEAKPGKPTTTETSTPAPVSTPTTPSEKTPDQTAKKTPDGPGPVVPAKTPGKKDILDVLGETGTKSGNPRVNPLDKKDDDLLKDLK